MQKIKHFVKVSILDSSKSLNVIKCFIKVQPFVVKYTGIIFPNIKSFQIELLTIYTKIKNRDLTVDRHKNKIKLDCIFKKEANFYFCFSLNKTLTSPLKWFN